MMRIQFMLVVMAFAFTPVFGQQLKTITGRLVTAAKEPVAGATIILRVAGTMAQADNQGNFSLRYNGKADTLLITHIGYAPQRIPVAAATVFPLYIEVTPLAGMMQEVVVNTGYQQVPRERATGSFTQVDNATFNEQVSTDVLSRLPAIAAGLSEGPKTSQGKYSAPGQLLIRGLSTINGPSAPLVVVDNFPYEGDLQNINPNDVESITLLKDAAAASIWGARAGNGVIVITTKKGRFHQKMQVEFNSNVTITQKPDLFYDPSISPTDLVDVESFLFTKGYRFSDTLSNAHLPFSPVYEVLFGEQNGAISPADATSQLNLLRNHDVRSDFNQYVYRQAVAQQYALNIRGGSDNIAWLLSGGFDKDLDVLSAGYNRLSLRSETTLQLTRRMQLRASVDFTGSKNTSGRDGYGNIITAKGTIPIYTRLADASGNPLPLAKDYRQSFIDSNTDPNLEDWNYYPLSDYRHNLATSELQDLVGGLSLSYAIGKGLSGQLQYQYERQTVVGRNLYDEQSYYTRNLINTFYQPAGDNTFPVPKGGILDLSNTLVTAGNARGQLNFARSWGRHDLVVIAGSEIRQLVSEGSSQRVYGYNDLLTLIPVDLVNYYPSFVTGDDLNVPDNSGLNETVNHFVSFFANAAYTYAQKYTASLSGRRDASNIFGVNTNDKWNPLWSAGASWLLSSEKFYHIAVLPYLKVRATYGVSGNIDPSLSALTTLSYRNASPYTRLPYAAIDRFANPDLRWEKNRQFNIGIDFSTAGNRVSGSVDYYIKKGIDLYGPSPLDQTTGLGVGTITKNAARMKARGLDVEINSVNTTGKVQWTTHLNLGIYHDKVTAYYLTSVNGSDLIAGGASISGIAGRPVNSVLSYRWGGLDPLTGDPQGYSGGRLSKDYDDIMSNGTSISDLVYSGPGLPTVYGSLGNTVSYHGISLTARITGKFGYYFKKTSVYYSSLFSSLTGSADYARRWQKPGDELSTYVPSMVYPASPSRDAFYNNSEVLVEKGDHIRLQYITLSWAISKKQWKNLPFENISFYMNLNDLGILWRANKDGLDPDYTSGSIPSSKNIAFGARVNF